MPQTFTWAPDNGATGETQYRTRAAQFGDGYSQAVGDGINSKVQSWPLTFTKNKATAESITEFFDDHQGFKAFIWTPPLGTASLWKVTQQTNTPLGGGMYRITATFEQSFHP
ncbi:phage tail protein [Shewanella baltica]|uniref:phage tail protein n=1 Tax=Shewanella baltica TaxID=62322 RepID=UPI00217E89AF|nr:phage tail protein [Shewanella baltica]MCS6235665.1 phage tail protein [Shewanella baltica]MCS6270172.1 phage tail protein [Shewanella baltica]